MDDVNIRFASVFLCPAPCRAEISVDQHGEGKCPVCGKIFEPNEITELLLSQGRYSVAASGGG